MGARGLSLRLTLISGLAAACALAQVAFEVASIRPNNSGSGTSSSDGRNGEFIGRNESLRDLIEHAYDVMEWQIDGPAWIRAERFDVMAKPPAGAPSGDFNAMMQNLLAERFKLKVHRESRETPVYALVEMKAGLKAAKVADDGQARTDWSRNHISAQHTSMARFAERLSRIADRPVVDRTGEKGAFDFELKWTPDAQSARPPATPAGTIADEPPSLFTAIQEQLGLRLEPAKAPVEYLVVDHAERIPTDN